jgi:hypothetical protein
MNSYAFVKFLPRRFSFTWLAEMTRSLPALFEENSHATIKHTSELANFFFGT